MLQHNAREIRWYGDAVRLAEVDIFSTFLHALLLPGEVSFQVVGPKSKDVPPS
jgi:hypothetical protein